MQREWTFDQNENVAAITTRFVLEEGYPILTVVHYEEDHSWGFFCGTTDCEEDGRVVSMKEICDLDITVYEISKLEPGMKAWRKDIKSEWNVIKG